MSSTAFAPNPTFLSNFTSYYVVLVDSYCRSPCTPLQLSFTGWKQLGHAQPCGSFWSQLAGHLQATLRRRPGHGQYRKQPDPRCKGLQEAGHSCSSGPHRQGRPPSRASLLPGMPIPDIRVQSLIFISLKPIPGIRVQSLMTGMRTDQAEHQAEPGAAPRAPCGRKSRRCAASCAACKRHRPHLQASTSTCCACANCCNSGASEARGRLLTRVSACCACSFNSLVVETTFDPDSHYLPSYCLEGLRFPGALCKMSWLHALILLKFDVDMIGFSFCVASRHLGAKRVVV